MNLSPTTMRTLWAVGLASLFVRGWIAQTLPITGDEAFFYWWGVFPDWGYYDHPPMVGWLITAMRYLWGDGLLSIRLPVVLLPLVLGGLMGWALYPWGRERAAIAVLLFWCTPLNWLNTLITTDTPLIFWSVLSAACLLRAEQRSQLDRAAWGLYGLCGVALGCAFLSKYFAVVLGLTYAVYFLTCRRERWHAFAVLVLLSLPMAAINIGWNISHGWPNIMFNLFNRNTAEVAEVRKPLLYSGMLIYLVTPAVVWVLVRMPSVKGWRAGWRAHRAAWTNSWTALPPARQLLALLVLVPGVFFAVLSIKKVIGLHWVLSFYPWVFAWLACALPFEKLRTCKLGLMVFTALHLVVLGGVAVSSLQDWKLLERYPTLVRSYQTQDVLDGMLRKAELERSSIEPSSNVKASPQPLVWMSDGYSPASVYGYTLGQYVPVFGQGKFHARQDDLLVDFSAYAGQDVLVMLSAAPDLKDFAPYFDRITPLAIEVSGATFHAVLGQGFNAQAYHSEVLGHIYQKYYQIPQWLPMTGCPFCERYCGAVRCK